MRKYKDILGRTIKFGDIVIASDFGGFSLNFYKIMRSLTKREIEDEGFWLGGGAFPLVAARAHDNDSSCSTDFVEFECKTKIDETDKNQTIIFDVVLVEKPLMHVNIPEIAALIDYNIKSVTL